MLYVGSPYSTPDIHLLYLRVHQVTSYCATLAEQGILCYSPIIHNHHINQLLDADPGFNYWKKHDLYMLKACISMEVLCLRGWQNSVGLKEEITFAEANNIPVRYIG